MSGYIGTAPVPQATQTRDSFTATSGQTSFATGGYTPQFLDVYLNGVKLSAADYTASNGSDVVLASGAATGDILEVVAYTAFDTANVTGATNFTVTGAFTSQGIDDNGNATAITIDSSEHVLVGTTDSAVWNDTTGTGGINLRSDGILAAARNGGEPLLLNRLGTDGELIKLNKNGTTVGSINSLSGRLAIGTGNTGLFFDSIRQVVTPHTITGNTYSTTLDLGRAAIPFKDAYLSGGVYLGGTGSANKLDDYEEGTFTPLMQGSITNPSYGGGKAGRYTKIGNIVHFSAYVDMNPYNSNGNGDIYFAGLPFTVDGSDAGATRNISLSIWGPTIGSGYSISGQPVNNSNYLQFALWGDNRGQVVWTYSTASFSSGDAIYIQGHYFTNS